MANVSSRNRLWCLALVSLGLAACSGPSVALNERTYELPEMTYSGGGCAIYQLSPNASNPTSESGCAPGAKGACFRVVKETEADAVRIQIFDGDALKAAIRYDEAFFRSGRVDEFTVTAASGKQELFRYWGIFDVNDCAVVPKTDRPPS